MRPPPAAAPASPASPAAAAAEPGLLRTLGVRDGALLTVGAVVGTGIFLTPGDVARALPHPALVLAAWLAGGALTLAGALAYAEMGALFPRAGGLYHFLREAWGPLVAFLYGWTCLLVIMSGGIAAIAIGFAEYLGALVPALSKARALAVPAPWGAWTVSAPQLVAAGAIVALTAVNHRGVRAGSRLQNAFTLAKLAAIAALAAGVALAGGVPAGAPAAGTSPPAGLALAAAFGAALIPVLWTFDGWYALTFAAGEVRDPQRTLPRGLLAGLGIVLAVYLVLNLVYLAALPLPALAATPRAAEAAALALFGAGGARWVAAAVAVSAFGCLAATVLYASRIYQPMAADGAFFRSVAAIHPRWRTPAPALWLQGGWAAALALTGGYTQLFTYVTFGGILFHVAAGLALFRLRRTRPDLPRPYRAWGYPLVPALFVAGMLLLTGSTLLGSPVQSLLGLLAILAGVPAFAAWRRSAPRLAPAAALVLAAPLAAPSPAPADDGRASSVSAAPGGIAPLRGLASPAAGSRRPDTLAAAPARDTLPEVVVTATRVPMRRFDVPYMAHVVPVSPATRHLRRGATDALRDVPGVLPQKTAPGQGSPFCRGFTGFRVVHLIDGVRLNHSVFREGPNQYWSTVDLLGLEKIEAVMGPGSVLHGSDAVGATLQAVSTGSGPLAGGPPWRGSLEARLASAERSHGGRAEIEIDLPGPAWARAGWSGRRFGDLEGGGAVGRQPGTGFDENALDLHAVWPQSRGGDLTLLHQRVRQEDVPRTHVTRAARSFAGTTVGTDLRRDIDQARDLTLLRHRSGARPGLVERWTLAASWQRVAEREHRVTASGAVRDQGFDVGTAGLTGQLETAPLAAARWVAGFEAYHDEVDSRSSANPVQGPVADDAGYALLGAYLEGRFRPLARLELFAGGRLTHARARAARLLDPATGEPASLSQRFDAWTGSLRADLRVVEDRVAIFAGLSQGFRAPNLSDLTRFDNARTREFEVPAPGLEPERFLGAEAGVKLRRGGAGLSAAAFRTGIRDQIIRRPTGAMRGSDFEVTRDNAGRGSIHGVELEASAALGRGLALEARGSWQEGWLTQYPTSAPTVAREPYSRLMPLTILGRLRWSSARRTEWLEAELVRAGRQDRLSTADRLDTSRIPPGGTPGYTVVSVRGGFALLGRSTVTLAVENLADVDYRIHGSGTNEPGRSGILGVRLAF